MALPTQIIVALGANLAHAGQSPIINLKYSITALECDTIRIVASSRWYQSPAFPAGSGPDYVNAALTANTNLPVEKVLERLHQVEDDLGRQRSDRWGARACDLDLIAFGDRVLPDIDTYNAWRNMPLAQQKIETPQELILPHPRVQERAFVLVPIRDVLPNWEHPVTGQSLSEMINALPLSDINALKVICENEA